MHRIDGPTAAPGGLWTDGDPIGGVPATIVSDDWMNDTQENLIAVLTAAGISPVKGDYTQLLAAIRLATPGRLLRTTTYINVGGVLQISVDGAAFAAAESSSFTKHPLAIWADAEVQGSGGGGGSANSTAAGQAAAGSGGGGGGYSRKRFAISALNGQSITVGAGAAANIAGNSSSIGILVTASGGGAGINGANVTPDGRIYEGRPGGVGTGGDLNAQGGFGYYSILASVAVSGKGGSSMFGDGAAPAVSVATTGAVGNAAVSYGSGGSGAANGASVPSSKAGGTGASGIIIIREYA